MKQLKDLSKDKVKKEFIKFLQENDVYNIFKAYASYKMDSLFIAEPPINWIIDAFSWKMTYEGASFWSDLNNKWTNKLIEERKSNNSIIDVI